MMTRQQHLLITCTLCILLAASTGFAPIAGRRANAVGVKRPAELFSRTDSKVELRASRSNSKRMSTPATTKRSKVFRNKIVSDMHVEAEFLSEPYEVVDQQDNSKTLLLYGGGLAVLAAVAAAATTTLHVSPSDVLLNAVQHPQQVLTSLVDATGDMGDAAPLYFGLLYFVAEILAVPVTPLTMSAGYLFGLQTGVPVVLAAATAAACFGFGVGRTIFRSSVEQFVQENPNFAKLDKAVGQEAGFKLLVLIRLTPIFPFGISNYVCGASSMDFFSYFWGTVIGAGIGSLFYVYTGMVGQALIMNTAASGGEQPWYVYVGGLLAATAVLKLVTDSATEIVQAINDDDDE